MIQSCHPSSSMPGFSQSESYPEQFSEKAMAPHSNTLAWKIPWMEEPGRLQSMGSWKVRHDWVTSLSLFTFMHWRRRWQPTPVFLPGESQGRGSLVAAVYGVAQSQTWLKRFSSGSNSRAVLTRTLLEPFLTLLIFTHSFVSSSDDFQGLLWVVVPKDLLGAPPRGRSILLAHRKHAGCLLGLQYLLICPFLSLWSSPMRSPWVFLSFSTPSSELQDLFYIFHSSSPCIVLIPVSKINNIGYCFSKLFKKYILNLICLFD